MVQMKITIRHKLFLTLLTTSTVVAVTLFVFLQWNFDRGFFRYIKQQEVEELNLLITKLAHRYSLAGTQNWDFLQDDPFLWRAIHIDIFSHNKGLSLSNRELVNHNPPPPQGSMRDIGPRVLLYDHNKNWVIGGPPDFDTKAELATYPIHNDKEIIGYLGLIPSSTLSYSGDLVFMKEQYNTFYIVALSMFLMSLLLAFPLTSHLLRPINQLIYGTIDLVKGHFSTRIDVKSSDELGTLSKHFNILATTLEKNEQTRKQWVADISHELRTPLSILRGDVEAIQDGVRVANDESITLIHHEVLHIERLVNDLYELSMSEIGALSYKKSVISPAVLLQETVTQITPQFEAQGVEVHFEIQNYGSINILGDPDRLQQLFTNILGNSLKYTQAPGGVYIHIHRKDNTFIFEFEDTAPAVTKEQLPFIFDRLYRTDSSRNRESYGAGLGLTICKNIVEAHQGEITAKISNKGGLHLRVVVPIYR